MSSLMILRALKKYWQSIFRTITLTFGKRPALPQLSCLQIERLLCSNNAEQSNASQASSMPLTKPSVNGNIRHKILLYRCVKNKNRWEGKDPNSDVDTARAAEDFALRKNEDYLSFYEVEDEAEG